jgi:hypothetical protein
MGKILDQIYGVVEQRGGLKARLELAKQTGISRTDAGNLEDTEEAAKKFLKIASDILGENITPLITKGS